MRGDSDCYHFVTALRRGSLPPLRTIFFGAPNFVGIVPQIIEPTIVRDIKEGSRLVDETVCEVFK